MRISGVFEVLEEMSEIGGEVGDHVLVRPGEGDRCCILMRKLRPTDASHVLRCDRTRLISTNPPTPFPSALRELRAGMSCRPHLRLVE